MDGETGYSTIHWIRAEVDATLNQARQALEAYVEHPEDNSHLRQCATCLQQVRGTLQIVELMGGAELAQEMERLADLIAEDEQRRQPEVYELLMRAMLILINYLEWIRCGHDDLPLALVSSINEIRSVRGVEPLAETALFAPDLSCIPADLALSNDRDEISSLARRIRPLYESALVEWLRQRDKRMSLMRMARAIKQLEQSSTLPKTARIWWIVGGIIEALLDQGLEPTLSLKQALGHVDGLIKTLGESGDEGLAHALSDKFTKGLLYHVAKARSHGIKVMGVKEVFQLDSILPREHVLEEIRLSLSAPTVQLWESVAPALLEDLARVKDALDVLARQGGWSLEALQPIEDTLQRLSHTLEMLGLDRIRQLILEQLGRLQAMAGCDQSRAASELASLAKDLLYAELLVKRTIETDHRSSLEEDGVMEDRELLTTVIQTAKADMLKVIEAIDAFIRSPEQGELQQSVPVLFKRIVGALSMLSFSRAAGLFEACNRYITEELLEKRVLPDHAILDTLADVLAGLEQYLRALEENRVDRQGLLDKVQQNLDSLVQGSMEKAQLQQIPVIEQDLMIDPLALTTRIDPLIAEEQAAPAAETAQEPLLEPSEAAVLLKQCEQSLSHDSQLLTSPPALEAQSAVRELLEGCLTGSQPIPEPVSTIAPPPGIDPDLIEVFLEEAQEQLASIAQDIPHWQARVDDDETLRRLRRSFHTLKGSGRLVGARMLGEFAWAFEDMLNRVIDGTLLPSSAVFAVLQQAPEALTQLIGQLRDGFAPTADIAGLTDQVYALHRAPIAEPAAREELGSIPVLDQAPVVAVLPAEEPDITAEPLDARANTATVEVPPNVPALPEITAVEPSTIEVLEPVATEGSLDAQPNATANGGEPSQETPTTWGAFEHEAPTSVSSLEADSELAQIFFQEATDLIDANELTVQNWIQDPGNIHWCEELQRALHTLKGSARMAGVSAMGDLSHSLESLLVASVEGRVPVSPSLFELMQSGNDTLAHMLESVRNGQAVARASDLIERVDALISQLEGILPADEPEPSTSTDMPAEPFEMPEGEPARDESDQSLALHRPGSETHSDQPAASVAGEKTQYEQVRVRASLLDSLVNFAAEVSIYHARLKQQVHTFHSAIEEFAQTTVRIQEQLRRLSIETEAQMLFRASPPTSLLRGGDASSRSLLTSRENLGPRVAAMGQDYAIFDPLELDRYTLLQQLSRSMLESVSDLENIRGLLSNVTCDSEMLLIQQGRVHTELQEGLMRTRMLPFAVLVPRLRRVVRQVSAELGKPVNLRVDGEDNEIDRTVMDRIAAPLEHMLRNAVGHGLEAVQRRQSQGKPATGLITIHLCKEGTEVVLQMSDDGVGIDLAAVRRKAVERGLMAEDTVLSDRELMHFILEPGFSTATKVSQVSGRGVGMDVVDNVVKQLGGTLSIASKQGSGTTFTMRLPLMLSITQALVVKLGEEIYAIPLAHIRAVVQMRQAELERYYAAAVPRIDYAGETYQLLSLGALIDSPPGEFRAPEEKTPLLLLATGNLRVALQVDSLAGRREIVVKSMGLQLSSVKGLLGATILGDGRVALILDTTTLARRAVGQMKSAVRQAAVPVAKAPEKAITVLVVDDSITMRKVTARLLERHHMHVLTAKDGVDALEQLQNHVPDVAVLDIEMPRMDGYELARHIRHTPDFKHIPIIMITSRIGEKHREHARQIGVNRYLGKPYQETELLDSIYELLPERF